MQQWLLLLCQAARLGHLAQLQQLTGRANARCWGEGFLYGGSLLHEAAGAGHVQVVQLLLDHGAEVDSKDRFEMTPLGWAAWGGHVAAAQALLAAGAQVDARDEFLTTPLGTAVKEGHSKVAELLIEHQADLNAQGQLGTTPLMEAAKGGHLAVAQLLLQHHCDVDATDRLGRPALVEATVKGDLKMVQLLVDEGANVFGNTKQGLPYYLTGTSQVNDYLYQQMKVHALLSRPWVGWVLLVAPLLGLIWTLLQLDIMWGPRSIIRMTQEEELQELPEESQESPFLQGAQVLIAKSEKTWIPSLVFRMLEASTCIVLIFALGLGVVWWLPWIPLHLLLYLLPQLRLRPMRELLSSPELLLNDQPWIQAARTLLLLTLLLAVSAWHHTQCYLAHCLGLAWTTPICHGAVRIEGLPFDALRNPSLNWYDVLLNPVSSWRQPGSTTVFGLLVQPYLVTCVFLLCLFLAAVVYCLWLLFNAVHAWSAAPSSPALPPLPVKRLLHSPTAEYLPHQVEPETAHSIYGTLTLLLLDLLFDLNTVYVLMFTGNPNFAFVLMVVISRTVTQYLAFGNVYHLKEAVQESLLRGMMRQELMVMIDVHGFQAFASLCLTCFSYWFCIQTAWQALVQMCSILLSLCSFSLFMFHRLDVSP